jgi:hypothetical protein
VGVDLSAYQTGKYRLDLYQTSTGILWAQGFISATAPSGEALTDIIGGTNPALRNGDFSLGDNGDWQKQSTWAISGGVAIATLTSTSGYLYQLNLPTNGILVKMSGDFTVSNGSARFALNGNVVSSPAITATGSYSAYRTVINNFANGVYAPSGGGGFTGTVDNLFFQQVTMPAATGALLLSSYGGSRGFVFKHASFDPDAALSYKIVKVID